MIGSQKRQNSFLKRKVKLFTFVSAFFTSSVSADTCLPDNFVDLNAHNPAIAVVVRYAGSDNFLGRPVKAYNAHKLIVSGPVAIALDGVQKALEKQGLGLLVYDAYRPQQAVDDFMAWIADASDTINKAKFYPDIEKNQLVPEGYIAEKSGHSRGSAVDLTIIDLTTGEPLDMGSDWDFFGEISHIGTEKINEAQTKNRKILQNAMEDAGFNAYHAEWWHFWLKNEPYPDTYFACPIE